MFFPIATFVVAMLWTMVAHLLLVLRHVPLAPSSRFCFGTFDRVRLRLEPGWCGFDVGWRRGHVWAVGRHVAGGEGHLPMHAIDVFPRDPWLVLPGRTVGSRRKGISAQVFHMVRNVFQRVFELSQRISQQGKIGLHESQRIAQRTQHDLHRIRWFRSRRRSVGCQSCQVPCGIRWFSSE
jgi:hypothetical protein